jgi:hypothetical protein
MSVRFNPGALGAQPQGNFSQLLFKGSALNFQLTTDQPLIKVFPGSAYTITGSFARQRSGAASALTAGGMYDTASKGGNAVIGATQAWATLASGVIVSATLASLVATTLLSNTLILSLTTGSTSACTADCYVFGVDMT